MSMNCLTCQALQRTQSEKENYGYETSSRGKSCCIEVTRRWSADLTPPSYEPIKPDGGSPRKSFVGKKVKNRRLRSDGGNEPRLVRSSGMRRDWSFEDLRLRDQKKGRFH